MLDRPKSERSNESGYLPLRVPSDSTHPNDKIDTANDDDETV